MSTKRAAEEIIPEQKRARIRLASPSPERSSESDTESIHSSQGYKTELANDTNDTSSSPSPSPEPESIEYEIAEPEPVPHKFRFYFSDDCTDEENILDDVFSLISSDSLDNAVFGDTSEEVSTSPTSNSDVDPGLPRNDYLDFEKCLLCKTDQKDISYPYCTACFKWRKNFFPRRPKRRVNGFKKNEIKSKKSNKESCNSSLPYNESEKNCPEMKTKESNLSDGVFEDSGVGSSEPQLSEDTIDGPSQPSTSISASSTSVSSNVKIFEPCKVCFLKPENGLFVHSNSAHLYGCYNCAKEIWYHNGGCPLCRRKVFKVTRLYA